MTITKCDICKKDLKDRDAVIRAGVSWHLFELCASCGKTVRTFLEKNKLVEKEKRETKKK